MTVHTFLSDESMYKVTATDYDHANSDNKPYPIETVVHEAECVTLEDAVSHRGWLHDREDELGGDVGVRITRNPAPHDYIELTGDLVIEDEYYYTSIRIDGRELQQVVELMFGDDLYNIKPPGKYRLMLEKLED